MGDGFLGITRFDPRDAAAEHEATQSIVASRRESGPETHEGSCRPLGRAWITGGDSAAESAQQPIGLEGRRPSQGGASACSIPANAGGPLDPIERRGGDSGSPGRQATVIATREASVCRKRSAGSRQAYAQLAPVESHAVASPDPPPIEVQTGAHVQRHGGRRHGNVGPHEAHERRTLLVAEGDGDRSVPHRADDPVKRPGDGKPDTYDPGAHDLTRT